MKKLLALFLLSLVIPSYANAQSSVFPGSGSGSGITAICTATDVDCSTLLDGSILVYSVADGLFNALTMSGDCTMDETGAVACSASGGGHDIYEENVLLATQAKLRFLGLLSTCANNGGNSSTDCTIAIPDNYVADSMLDADYSGVGTCTNQFVRALGRDVPPTCQSIADADIPSLIARDSEVPGLETDADHDTAAEIGVTPAGDIAATDVQAALEELDTEKALATTDGEGMEYVLGILGLEVDPGSGTPTIAKRAAGLRVNENSIGTQQFVPCGTDEVYKGSGGQMLCLPDAVGTGDMVAPPAEPNDILTCGADSDCRHPRPGPFKMTAAGQLIAPDLQSAGGNSLGGMDNDGGGTINCSTLTDAREWKIADIDTSSADVFTLCFADGDYFKIPYTGSDYIGSGEFMVGTGVNAAEYRTFALTDIPAGADGKVLKMLSGTPQWQPDADSGAGLNIARTLWVDTAGLDYLVTPGDCSTVDCCTIAHPCATIQQAINEATELSPPSNTSGVLINIGPGFYNETELRMFNTNSASARYLVPANSVTLRGANKLATTIGSALTYSTFLGNGQCTINGTGAGNLKLRDIAVQGWGFAKTCMNSSGVAEAPVRSCTINANCTNASFPTCTTNAHTASWCSDGGMFGADTQAITLEQVGDTGNVMRLRGAANLTQESRDLTTFDVGAMGGASVSIQTGVNGSIESMCRGGGTMVGSGAACSVAADCGGICTAASSRAGLPCALKSTTTCANNTDCVSAGSSTCSSGYCSQSDDCPSGTCTIGNCTNNSAEQLFRGSLMQSNRANMVFRPIYLCDGGAHTNTAKTVEIRNTSACTASSNTRCTGFASSIACSTNSDCARTVHCDTGDCDFDGADNLSNYVQASKWNDDAIPSGRRITVNSQTRTVDKVIDANTLRVTWPWASGAATGFSYTDNNDGWACNVNADCTGSGVCTMANTGASGLLNKIEYTLFNSASHAGECVNANYETGWPPTSCTANGDCGDGVHTVCKNIQLSVDGGGYANTVTMDYDTFTANGSPSPDLDVVALNTGNVQNSGTPFPESLSSTYNSGTIANANDNRAKNQYLGDGTDSGVFDLFFDDDRTSAPKLEWNNTGEEFRLDSMCSNNTDCTGTVSTGRTSLALYRNGDIGGYIDGYNQSTAGRIGLRTGNSAGQIRLMNSDDTVGMFICDDSQGDACTFGAGMRLTPLASALSPASGLAEGHMWWLDSSNAPQFYNGTTTKTFAALESPTFTTPSWTGTAGGGALTLTTPLAVGQGGTGVATSGALTDIAVGGGTGSAIVWTAATGNGAPVRANTPTLITPVIGAATGTSLVLSGGLTLGGNSAANVDVAFDDDASANRLFGWDDTNNDFEIDENAASNNTRIRFKEAGTTRGIIYGGDSGGHSTFSTLALMSAGALGFVDLQTSGGISMISCSDNSAVPFCTSPDFRDSSSGTGYKVKAVQSECAVLERHANGDDHWPIWTAPNQGAVTIRNLWCRCDVNAVGTGCSGTLGTVQLEDSEASPNTMSGSAACVTGAYASVTAATAVTTNNTLSARESLRMNETASMTDTGLGTYTICWEWTYN